MIDVQANIDEGCRLVESLLGKRPVQFRSANMPEIPQESGIYLFSNRATGEFLYVGESSKGAKGLWGRVYQHWDLDQGSDLAQMLVTAGIAKDRSGSRDWIRGNVDIRWLTRVELGVDIKWAEYFALGALRPKLNK